MVVKESFQYCHFGIRAHVPSSRPVLTFLGAILSLNSPLLACSTALRVLNSYRATFNIFMQTTQGPRPAEAQQLS